MDKQTDGKLFIFILPKEAAENPELVELHKVITSSLVDKLEEFYSMLLDKIEIADVANNDFIIQLNSWRYN